MVARAEALGLDSGKLVRLVAELNYNYSRGNAYAAHALLRAVQAVGQVTAPRYMAARTLPRPWTRPHGHRSLLARVCSPIRVTSSR
jgi:hypothetical protein